MYLKSLLFCILFQISFFAAIGQSISADKTSGCVPLTVTLTASGTGPYSWDFGNGTSAGNSDSVTAYYITPGTYTVTGTINGVPKTLTINVFPKPVAGFQAISSTDSCAGLNVIFQDTSTGGGGTSIATWSWTFGDGGSATSQNTSHIYTFTPGSPFNVALTVVDGNGCNNTYTANAYVHISSINVSITTLPSPSSSCTAPFLVQFTGQATSISGSSTGTITDYIWNFGNGNSSILQTDTSTYFSEGAFNATLTVIDEYNCHKTIPKQILINNPVANFVVNDPLPPNDTVCQNVILSNTSIASGNATYQWIFGDSVIAPFASITTDFTTNPVFNTTGTYDSLVHTYNNPDAYNQYIVSLIVSSTNLGLTCKDTLTDTIWVDGVRANFTSVPTYGCQVPLDVTYDGGISTNAAQWEWTFLSDTEAVSGPNTASGQVVTNTIITTNPNEYTVHWMELFDVELLVTSPDGCIHDTIYKSNDTIWKPTALFMPDTIYGCFPLTVTFYDSSKAAEDIDTLTWFFGDGSDTTGTKDDLDTIMHTYTQPGTDTVFLIIKTELGCIDTSYNIIIYVGAPPNINFSADLLSVCPGDTVNFTDLTPIADSVDTWHYVSDGILMWSCPGDPNPAYTYNTNVGFFDVTLKAGYNGCFSETTIANMIEVKGPIAASRYEGDCDAPFTYNFFSDSSNGFTSLSWNFGDGSPVSNLANPTHTYSVTGDYTVVLTAINNTSGCPDATDTIFVNVRNIKAVIVTDNDPNGRDTLFCSGVAAQLDASPSIDVYNYCYRGYRWDWNDSTPPDGTDNPVIQHEFDTSGIYEIRLVVTDTNGCTDTAFQNVIVHKVLADFVMDTNMALFPNDTLLICVPQTVQFTNMSVSDTSIFSWFWTSDAIRLNTPDPVNDTVVNPANQLTSSDTNPTFSYPTYNSSWNAAGVGYFKVWLTVTDTLGCWDTISYYLKQSYPDSNFSVNDFQLCAGDSSLFTASNGNIGSTYLWDFGDEGSDSVKSPYHIYDTAGTYTVNLITTDSIGCDGNRTKPNYIIVQDYPVAGFYMTTSDGDTVGDGPICFPKTITFHDTTKLQYPNLSYLWNYTTGVGTTSDPTGSFPLPTTYPIKLTVTTTFGCKDSLNDTLSLVGPQANLYVSQTAICLYDTIKVAIKTDSVDVFSWYWNFGDGTGDTSKTDTLTHIYTYHPPSGSTSITLTVYDPDSLCPTPIQQSISIYDVKADFSINDPLNDTARCLNQATFNFTNQSTSSGTISDYNWNFGDGLISVGGNQTHVYTTTGTFNVGLFIGGTPSGGIKKCVDTIFKEIIVFPLPTAVATGNDTCKGDSIQIFSSGGLSYLWSPATGLSSNAEPNPFASPSSTTTYTVTVTDINGCQGTANTEVLIYEEPPQYMLDTAIHIGEEVPMNFDLGTNYTYTWTPTTEWLSCITCPNPTAKPMEDIVYEVVVEDNIGCFSVISKYTIDVLPDTTLDFPDAFTPEAGVNNIVYVNGWGIKTLHEFKIYNRWGQMVYENPGDIKQGWDGTYLGKIQNMDTYVYYIKAETYLSPEPKILQGHLLLIR